MSSPRTANPQVADATVSRERRRSRTRLLALLTIVAIAAAWIAGTSRSRPEVVPILQQIVPQASAVDESGGLWLARSLSGGPVIAYAATGRAPGYGGPIEVLVAVDPDGKVLGMGVIENHETPGFFRLLGANDFFGEFIRSGSPDPVHIGEGVDAVSGATLSSDGVAAAARMAIRDIAASGLQMSVPPEKQSIRFGMPELTLILLFAAGYVGHKLRDGRWKRRVRWGTMLTGMIVLGFVYTAPLTIANFISLASGYWPDWHTNLYWYILIGGILFVTSAQGKNPYCSWFCPFGAYQECLGAVSGAKPYRPRTLNGALTWVQRGLALAAVILGLALRRPGAASYEPFPVLFDLRGNAFEWGLLVAVTLSSLMMYRPFCGYLCPLAPVVDYIGEFRRWIRESWRAWRKARA
jgi:NosR/NirI family nitrous oxide reductase transcriptional regulator